MEYDYLLKVSKLSFRGKPPQDTLRWQRRRDRPEPLRAAGVQEESLGVGVYLLTRGSLS